MKHKPLAREVAIERFQKGIGFFGTYVEKCRVDEHQPIAAQLQVHGVCAQPVAFLRCAVIARERERRDGPVLLALDCERLAKP